MLKCKCPRCKRPIVNNYTVLKYLHSGIACINYDTSILLLVSKNLGFFANYKRYLALASVFIYLQFSAIIVAQKAANCILFDIHNPAARRMEVELNPSPYPTR